MILFCIRKEGDLDNFIPIIYNLSLNLENKIFITSVDLSFSYKKDFRLKFLKNNSKSIKYINPEDLFDFNFFQKIIIKIFFFKNIKKYNYSLNNFINTFLENLFKYVKIKSDFNKLKLLIIDHVHPSKILIIKNLIKYNKKIRFKIISIPHGIPLLKKHNSNWDIAKKDIVEMSKLVNLTILQHKFWYNELKYYNISKNTKILGSPRFSKEWINLYSKIVPNHKLKYFKEKINIVYMSANSDSHIDYFSKKIETIEFLQNNKNINLIYKSHPRTNFSSLKIKKLKFSKNINSRFLIRWADIIIGDISSIMVDALLLNKLYISPSYLRFTNNRLIFEDYHACLEIKTFENLKNFLNSINVNNKNNILSQELKKYEKNKNKFITEIIYNNSENVINDYIQLIKNHI